MDEFVSKFQTVYDTCGFLNIEHAEYLLQQAKNIDKEYKRALSMEYVLTETIKIHVESCTEWADKLLPEAEGAKSQVLTRLRESFVGPNGEAYWEMCANGWAESTKLKNECAEDYNKLMIVLYNICSAANKLYEKLYLFSAYETMAAKYCAVYEAR
jgi:hypothetical protein